MKLLKGSSVQRQRDCQRWVIGSRETGPVGKGWIAQDHVERRLCFFSKDTGKPLRHFSLWRDTLRSAFGKIHSGCDVDNGREGLTGQGKEVRELFPQTVKCQVKKHRTRQHHIHSAGNTDRN